MRYDIACAHDPARPSHVQTGNVTDAHAIEAGAPITDECTQDWTLVSSEVDADSLVFVAERALNTGDTQDHVFVDDSADGECCVTTKGNSDGAKQRQTRGSSCSSGVRA